MADAAASNQALIACPSCGHEASVTAGARMSIVCPRCGGSLAAVVAAAEVVEADRADQAGRPATAAPLGSHAAKGFTFMLAQSLGTRVIVLVSQLILAAILFPKDWGTLAIADTIATFANLLQLIGIREFIVARQKKFHVWENAAFWITSTAGIAAGLLVAAAAPIAGRLRDNPDLTGIMLVLALTIPLYSFSSVSESKLQKDLRFKYFAMVIAVWATIIPVLTVVFALLGFGVYSFVIPRVIASLVRLIMTTRAARPRVRLNPQVRRWRYFAGTSTLMFFTSLLLLIVQVGDRPILSAFVDENELGYYQVALAFSLQTILMVSINLQGVLFATLAKLNDEPARQLHAFLRASRALAAIVTPICLIQAAAAEPLLRTLFNYDKWGPATTAMQILAVGMVFYGAYCPAGALLDSHRRFAVKFKLALANAIVYLGAVLAGAWLGLRASGPVGAVSGAALGVSIAMIVMSPIWSYITTRSMGGGWMDTLGIVTRPFITASIAIGLGLLAAWLLARPAAGVHLRGIFIEHWVRLLVTCSVSAAAYVVLMRFTMPQEFKEIGSKFLAIIRRLSPTWASRLGRLMPA